MSVSVQVDCYFSTIDTLNIGYFQPARSMYCSGSLYRVMHALVSGVSGPESQPTPGIDSPLSLKGSGVGEPDLASSVLIGRSM